MSGLEGSIVQFDNVGLRYGTEREVLSDVSFTYDGSRLRRYSRSPAMPP